MFLFLEDRSPLNESRAYAIIIDESGKVLLLFLHVMIDLDLVSKAVLGT